MSQLGLGLGLSNVSSLLRFSPLDLDPYLLFDTQSSMIGTLENPTLDLDPANPDTLDVITASRAGVATYTDADGLIQSASADTVRVDYTQGEQLTPTKFQRVSNTDYFSSPNFAENTTLQYVTGPTGELDAVRVTEDATTDYHYLAMRADVVSGTTYAISFYIKQGSYPTARVFTQSLYMVKNTTVNFSTETASGGGIMENVGDGWYRVTFTGTSNLTGTMIVYATVTNLNSYAGDVNNFTDYYGFQVEEGTTASSFVANTTGSPKFISSAVYSDRVPMILVEPSAINLLTYSEDFSNAAWTKNNVTLTADYGIAPDGNNTSTRIQYSGSGYIFHNVTSGTYTASAFVKGVAGEVVKFGTGPNVGQGAEFTLNGEWQRIQQTGTGNIIFFSSLGGNTATDFEIWGAQGETGSVATSYIPTSGGDAAARTRAADDLQIERDSTNLVSYSTPDTNWPLSEATRIEDFASSPDGSQTATKITKVGNDANDRTFFEDVALSNGTQYSASVYLKNVDVQGYTTLGVRVAGGTLFRIQINWSTNTVFNNNGTTSDRFVREAGDGWYRIGFSFTADGTNSDFEIDVDRSGATATDTSSVLVWGAQIEEGSEATSLIPTSGATASRTTFSDFYNQSEGTFYVESNTRLSDGVPFVVEADNGTNNRIALYYESNEVRGFLKAGGVVTANPIFGNRPTAGNLSRTALSYKTNDFEGSVDGGSVIVDTSATIPTTINRFHLGSRFGQSDTHKLNGHLKRVLFWPYSSDRL